MSDLRENIADIISKGIDWGHQDIHPDTTDRIIALVREALLSEQAVTAAAKAWAEADHAVGPTWDEMTDRDRAWHKKEFMLGTEAQLAVVGIKEHL